ncbi:MAG: FprA family A-type flavoprotein [Planctomycetes bacterium]|nr:FprA family A-type flavoprotein [Planctomycetota bacterium]
MKKILIAYHSQEKGNTRKLAELVARGCKEFEDVAIDMVNVYTIRVEPEMMERADGYALGSPDYFSYMAGGLKQFFDDMCLADWAGKKVKSKPYVAFMTHGGGGSGIKSIEELAKAMKLTQAAPPVTCKGAPDEAAAKLAVELGKKLAQAVLAT